MSFDKEGMKRKIAGLLAKAGPHSGATEAEAQSAMAKAQELMLEYAISDAEARGAMSAKASYIEFVAWEGQRVPQFQGLITGLINSHFGVKVIQDNRQRRAHKVLFYGTQDACDFASYALVYLTDTFHSLWLRRKIDMGYETRHKGAYYVGLIEGMREAMDAERRKVEQSATKSGMLVLIGRELDLAYRTQYPRVSNVRIRTRIASDDALADGQRDGAKVRVSRPLGDDRLYARIEAKCNNLNPVQ